MTPILLSEPELVTAARREERGDAERTYVLEYTLWRDVVSTGDAFYYIKCCRETWQAGSLLGADLEIADGLGTDAALASTVFHRIAGAREPLSPVHLKDVVRDAVVACEADTDRSSTGVTCAV